MKTIEEKFKEWLECSTAIAKKLKLEIEFTTEPNDGWDNGDSPIIEVCGIDPEFGYYKYSGSLFINL